jgi:cytochrome c-type biogenesis protein CcmH
MMPLALLLAGLTIAALTPLLLPLWRDWRAPAERRQFDRAVYCAQLAELDRDLARGLLSGPEIAATRLEIERRLLAADAAPTVPARLGNSRHLAIAAALIIVGGAGMLYLHLGAPGVPDIPYAERDESASNEVAARTQAEKQAAALSAKLKADPSNAADWLVYARAQAELSNWEAAADAFGHAIALGLTSPDVLAGQGEMLVMAANGIVGPAARTAFAEALKGDPQNQVARYYLALADAQAGEPRRAIAEWQALASELGDGSPMREAIARQVADAAKALGIAVPPLAQSEAGTIASMPPEQREQMIRGMVEKLATQLAAAPADPDGWMRLGRAYAVLGETDKAMDAYDRAAQLRPDGLDVRLQELTALFNQRAPSAPVPPRLGALLNQVAAVAPDQPEVLWYQGLAAAQRDQLVAAQGYWHRLLAVLPADSQEHKLVESALKALDRK